MSARTSQAKSENLPMSHIVGYLVFVTSLIFIPLIHITGYGRILGPSPLMIIGMIAILGGVITFECFVDPRYRVHAVIPGALSGLGAVSGLFGYVSLLYGFPMSNWLAILSEGVGALPGLLILWLLVSLFPRPTANGTNAK